MKIFDAHTHIAAGEVAALEALLEDSAGGGEFALAISVSAPEEAELAFGLREKYPDVYVTAGVHPWNAGKVKLEDMTSYIVQADAVGEIGLDSVWTDIDLDIQREVFFEQLMLARQLASPVVLHTKGCEEEIGELLPNFFGHPILMHWYSADVIYEGFKYADCYFTVAPDIEDPAQRRVVEQIPIDRLMTESDGAGTVDWLRLGKPLVLPESERISLLPDVPSTIATTIKGIASIKGVSEDEAAQALYQNALDFYHLAE
jgi:TatD DNase family protein